MNLDFPFHFDDEENPGGPSPSSGNVAAAIGGFAPAVVTWLMAATGDARAPAFYVIAAAIVSGSALFWLRDRYAEPLR